MSKTKCTFVYITASVLPLRAGQLNKPIRAFYYIAHNPITPRVAVQLTAQERRNTQ